MRQALRALTALVLAALLLTLAGCRSVKQVRIPEDREGWIAYGAITSNLFAMSDSHLAGILGVQKNELSAAVSRMRIRNAEDAVSFLNELLATGTRGAGQYYIGSDDLLEVSQGLLPTFEMVQEEIDLLRDRYEITCERLIARYGYTRQQLDAVTTVSAYDYDQLITMARLFFALDFIGEEEAWTYIETAASRAAEDYESWEAYAAGYVFGMMLVTDGDDHLTVLDELLLEESSPYLSHAFGG